MNYLEICQKVNSLVGLQGTFSTVATTTGYQKRLADTVATVWQDIQNYRADWDFKRRNASFATVVGQYEYSSSDMFGVEDTPVDSYYYLYNADDNTPITQITKDKYNLDSIQEDSNAPVSLWCFDEVSKNIFINPPSEITNLTISYFANLQTLSSNTDEPNLPSEHQNAIVYRAVSDLGLFFGDSNMYQLFDVKAKYAMNQLLRSQNPAKKIRIYG
jgi:hypothetical protein